MFKPEEFVVQHHQIFSWLKPYSGRVPEGFWSSYSGAFFRNEFYKFSPDESHLLEIVYPSFDEEYFEWIDLLESIHNADKSFVMIELGAGYGRWLINAWTALKRIKPDLPCHLVGVEAEPTHFKWLKQALLDNKVILENVDLFEAAVGARNGWGYFYVGIPYEWYGQHLTSQRENDYLLRTSSNQEEKLYTSRGEELKRVKMITLSSILAKHKIVDLIDLDVQGAELDIIQESIVGIDQKVKRVHIGTHNKAVEEGIRKLFNSYGWKCNYDYTCREKNSTSWGEMYFDDGVQSWTNPRFL